MCVYINKKLSFAVLIITVLMLGSCQQKVNKEGVTAGDHQDNGGGDSDAHQVHSNTVELSTAELASVGIRFGEMENRVMTETMKANGILRVPNKYTAQVSSLFGGVIQELYVQTGDQVSKGQRLARVVHPDIIRMQEDYLTLAAELLVAQQEEERQQELQAGRAGTVRNLQQAEAQLRSVRTRQASVGQQLQLMGINPRGLRIGNLQPSLTLRSPIAGTVRSVTASIGSFVDASSSLAEIVDNSKIHVDMQVYERDLPLVKVGQKLDFRATNNPSARYTAVVNSIGASFSGTSKTIAVHCRIEGDIEGLIDGMSIQAVVYGDGEAALAVPQEALVEGDGKHYIFVHRARSVLAAPHAAGGAHLHQEGHEDHDHAHTEAPQAGKEAAPIGEKVYTFEKIEVVKGVESQGYIAITPVGKLAPHDEVVTKGAFFIYAKMNDSGAHGHAH